MGYEEIRCDGKISESIEQDFVKTFHESYEEDAVI
jgi:hypothetical protein